MKYISLILLISSFLSMSAQKGSTYHSRRDWLVGKYVGIVNENDSGCDTSAGTWSNTMSIEIHYASETSVYVKGLVCGYIPMIGYSDALPEYSVCEDSILGLITSVNLDSCITEYCTSSGGGKLFSDSIYHHWVVCLPPYCGNYGSSPSFKFFKGKKIISYANVNNLAEDKFEIYPNPTNSTFNIKTNKTITSIELYNVSGKKLKVIDLQQNHKNIDVSDLKTGLYFYKVIIKDNNVYSGKLMIK